MPLLPSLRTLAGRPLVVTLLAALVLVLGLTLFWQQQADRPRTGTPGEPEMDAEIWGLSVRQRDGDRRWRLQADHAAHFPGPGMTRLSPVHLEVFSGEGPPVTAESRKGRIVDDTNRVTLRREVVLVDPAGYRLTTETLHYLPAAGRAETTDPVRVTAGFGVATGVGATIWTEERRMELHREVSTTLWRRPDNAS